MSIASVRRAQTTSLGRCKGGMVQITFPQYCSCGRLAIHTKCLECLAQEVIDRCLHGIRPVPLTRRRRHRTRGMKRLTPPQLRGLRYYGQRHLPKDQRDRRLHVPDPRVVAALLDKRLIEVYDYHYGVRHRVTETGREQLRAEGIEQPQYEDS